MDKSCKFKYVLSFLRHCAHFSVTLMEALEMETHVSKMVPLIVCSGACD